MSHIINNSTVVTSQLRTDLPEFKSGSHIKVSYLIKEGNKERVQVFEGIVIAIKNGKGVNGSFTVQKNSTSGVKVTRIFPLHSPLIQKIEVVSFQRGRRSKLYYLKDQKDPIKTLRAKPLKPRKKAEEK